MKTQIDRYELQQNISFDRLHPEFNTIALVICFSMGKTVVYWLENDSISIYDTFRAFRKRHVDESLRGEVKLEAING